MAERIATYVETGRSDNYDVYFRSIAGLPTRKAGEATSNPGHKLRRRHKKDEGVREHLDSKSFHYCKSKSRQPRRQRVFPEQQKAAGMVGEKMAKLLQSGSLICGIVVSVGLW